jgi:hypothetical protein
LDGKEVKMSDQEREQEERPSETEPNPTQERIDEEGPSDKPVVPPETVGEPPRDGRR